MEEREQAEERVEAANVTMYPRHWRRVDAYAREMAYKGRSPALQRIVDEWAEMKAGQLGLPFPVREVR